MGGMKPRGLGRVYSAWVMLGATSVVLLAASASSSSRWRRNSAGSEPPSLSVGSLAGGYLYDRFCNYTPAFQPAAFVAFVATLMALVIRERPASRRRPAMAVATAAGG